MNSVRTRLAVAVLAAALQTQVYAAPLRDRADDREFDRSPSFRERVIKVIRLLKRGVVILEDTPAPPKP